MGRPILRDQIGGWWNITCRDVAHRYIGNRRRKVGQDDVPARGEVDQNRVFASRKICRNFVFRSEQVSYSRVLASRRSIRNDLDKQIWFGKIRTGRVRHQIPGEPFVRT